MKLAHSDDKDVVDDAVQQTFPDIVVLPSEVNQKLIRLLPSNQLSLIITETSANCMRGRARARPVYVAVPRLDRAAHQKQLACHRNDQQGYGNTQILTQNPSIQKKVGAKKNPIKESPQRLGPIVILDIGHRISGPNRCDQQSRQSCKRNKDEIRYVFQYQKKKKENVSVCYLQILNVT